MDLIDILVIYNLVAACFFLLTALVLNGILYYRYLNSECIDSFSIYKKQDLIKGFKYWEAILRIFHHVISDLNYNDFISISLLCVIPLLREILIVLFLIFYIKEIIKKPFISIYLTNKRLEKLNKQMQNVIANGNSPTEKQITLAEKLNRRKKNLTQ